MPVGDWKCPYCRARNPQELVRCRICATVAPGVDFGSSPTALAPIDGPRDLITYAPVPAPGLAEAPPPAPPPPPPSPAKVDKVGLIALVVAVSVVAAVVLFFVVGTRTDPAAAKGRDQATGSLLTTGDIGGQWSIVHEEQHALGGGASRLVSSSSACSVPHDTSVEIQAWSVRDFSVQQGAVFAYVSSAAIVTTGAGEAAKAFDAFRLIAQPCIKALLKDAGADIEGFTVSLRETDELSVGDRSATFTGAFGVAGAAAFGVDALVVQSGRSMILLIDLDATGTIASKYFVDWAKVVADRLKRNLPAR